MTKKPIRPFFNMAVLDVACPVCGRGPGKECLDTDAKSLFAFGGGSPAHMGRWETWKAAIEDLQAQLAQLTK